MSHIPSLSSRIKELESDNECLRRLQYELLTTNSTLSANILDLQREVVHFRNEAELNDDRVLQMQVERDMAHEQLATLQTAHKVVVDQLCDTEADNVKLLNALREARARIAQLEYSEPQPDTTESGGLLEIKTVESKAKVERPVFKPSVEEAMKLRNAGQKNMPEEDIMLYLHNRDHRVRDAVKELRAFGGFAETEVGRMNETAVRIEKIIKGDPDA